MDLQNHSTTSRLLIAGVVLTFIVLLSVTWPLLRKAVPEPTNTTEPVQVVPERTPAEIISTYQSDLAGVVTSLESITSKGEAEKLMDDFFFSARVPDAARNAHLKAALEFKNTDPKKTDDQKLTAWKELIKKLQTAVAGV